MQRKKANYKTMKSAVISAAILLQLLLGGCVAIGELQDSKRLPELTEEPTTELPEVAEEPTPEPLPVEEVKTQKTFPGNEILVNTTPPGIEVTLNCTLDFPKEGAPVLFSEEGVTPVLFENVHPGTCAIYYYYTGCGTERSVFTYRGGREEKHRTLDTENVCFTIEELRGGRTEKFYDWEKEIKVGIIEVEPPGIVYVKQTTAGDKTFLELVNNPDGIAKYPIGPDIDIYPSFYYIDDWFNNEYERITGKELQMTIEVLGPIRLKEAIPENSDRIELFTFFDDLARANNINPSAYDVVNYVYFDPYRVWSETNAYQNAAFRSGTHPGANITIIDTEPSFGFWGVTQAVRKVIHEMSHVFGAFDTYEPAGGCKDPEGLPEPDKDPKFPQDKACIMCGCRMEKGGTDSCQSSQDIDIYVVCEKEARDFGWIQ